MPLRWPRWSQLHFIHQGSYSVERLDAFNNYCAQITLWRAVSVCNFFSLPAFLTSIALELIPLQVPSDGISANYGAWTRNFFIVLFNTLGILTQTNELVPQLSLSLAQILITSLASTCCYMVFMITVASCWVYPVPFGLVISIIPGALFVVVFFLLVVGPKRLQSSASLRRALHKQNYILAAQAMLAIVYPVFFAFYRRLAPAHRPFFVVLLPVIKMLMQHFVAWAAKDLQDHQPGIVIFCVDVFNALYSAKSLQSASRSARLTPLFIIGFDMVEFAFVVQSLHAQVTRIDLLYLQYMQRDTWASQRSFGQPLLDAVTDLCKQPGVLSDRTPLIRLQSSIKHSFPHRNQIAVNKIERKLAHTSCLFGKAQVKFRKIFPSTRSIKTAPIEHFHVPTRVQTAGAKAAPQEFSIREKQELLQLILKLLFQCEYYLLVKYVECAVPMMYTVYVAIVQQLPSAAYYPETKHLNAQQGQAIVLNLLVFAGLETILLLVLHTLVKTRCGFSPTYLLAFVLENQALELQGRLFVWYIILLQFTLVHFGRQPLVTCI